jgi:hypothetical protein
MTFSSLRQRHLLKLQRVLDRCAAHKLRVRERRRRISPQELGSARLRFIVGALASNSPSTPP